MATRAERSAQNKARQETMHEAREADKAERERERLSKAQARQAEAERIALARDAARARARAATAVLITDIPKTQGEVRAIAKALTPRMLELLVEIAEDPTQQASGRVAAINALIDRAHGKAVQPTVELPGAVLGDMDDEQLDVFLLTETKHFIDGKVNPDVQPNGTAPARVDAPPALGDARPADRIPKGTGRGGADEAGKPRTAKGKRRARG